MKLKLLVVLAGLVALTACQKAPVEDTTADEAAIRAFARDWADAYNSGDADRLANMYWEGAVLQPPNAPAAVGRDAIRSYLKADSAGLKAAGLTLVMPGDSVDVAGDLAYEAGNFTITDASGNTVDTGKYLGVFQKKDGKWLYIRDTWNSDSPPAPAGAPAG